MADEPVWADCHEKNARKAMLTGVFKRWSGPDLNWRHVDFQSTALPTELPDRVVKGRMLETGAVAVNWDLCRRQTVASKRFRTFAVA